MASPGFTLLNQHKRVLFPLIQEAGMDPVEFNIEDHNLTEPCAYGTQELVVSKVVHEPSAYSFIFGRSYLIWSPDRVERHGFAQIESGAWIVRVEYFKRWLGALNSELKAVDPWKVLQGQQSIQHLVRSSERLAEHFSRKEAKQIKAGLEAVKEEFIDLRTKQEEQWTVIQEKLDYLKYSADYLTKKDFILLALGQCMALAMNQIDAETIKALWLNICNAIAPFYGNVHRLLS